MRALRPANMGRSPWKGEGALNEPAKPKEAPLGVEGAEERGEGLSKVEGRLPRVSKEERYMLIASV